MLARILLAAGVVAAAPREAAHLPAEHRQTAAADAATATVTPHPIEDIVDAVLKSETMSAIDEAAAKVTTAFGDMIDHLGDFVVQRVKDLPETIKQVSDTVSQAVSDGGEQVVIVVNGVRKRVQNETAAAGNTMVNTVDRVADAADSSKTAASFQDLHERMAVSISRIIGSLFFNMDEIDTAMADGIRRISGDQTSGIYEASPRPSSQQNEVELIS